MVVGLRRIPRISLSKLPRMADFALWATACEVAIWEDGTFWNAYCDNQAGAVDGVLEADAVAETVLKLMSSLPEWRGTSSSLLGALRELAGEDIAKKDKSWPMRANTLSGRIRRLSASLRKVGINVDRGEGRARREIIITKAQPENRVKSPSPPSPPSSSLESNGLAHEGLFSHDGDVRHPAQIVTGTVTAKPSKSNGRDGHDDRDDENTHFSGQCCAQCRRDPPDGKELMFDVHGAQVWLHKECHRFYR